MTYSGQTPILTNIFTYGSLMFDRVWSLVVAGNYRKTNAILKGYDRKRVRGEPYPAIYQSSGLSQVRGVVYMDVSSADLARLDIFEGEYYFRRAEPVHTEDNMLVTAETYVLKEEYYPLISHKDWDEARFEKSDIYHFISEYIGFAGGTDKVQ